MYWCGGMAQLGLYHLAARARIEVTPAHTECVHDRQTTAVIVFWVCLFQNRGFLRAVPDVNNYPSTVQEQPRSDIGKIG